ncbi:class F sortase [Kibdelosporangium philippinense]|uniref:Class F sortase n=1 Tax=Kibdelosporangium philippinense TaxID=211113 RepID=A0ABS8ZTX3_9PSEU|nr:class F sortase [Kibdelosporangium philippinense]MCE7009267.1 class F sortase [Kibdelosporangium philippinense]
MRRKLMGGLIAATLTFALAACGSPPANSGAPAPTPTSDAATPAGSTEDGRIKPANVRIPKISAESTLVEAGLDNNKSIVVPPVDQPMQAAWYKYSQVPGDAGPSILLGHVDGNKKPGIFYKLHELKVGDEIFVKRKDGKELRFVTTRTEQVPKEQLPEQAIYGETPESELRLITCGGVFDKAAHSYKDNVIVYAKLAA